MKGRPHFKLYNEDLEFLTVRLYLFMSVCLSVCLFLPLSVSLSLSLYIYIFTQPLRSGRIWQKVNF